MRSSASGALSRRSGLRVGSRPGPPARPCRRRAGDAAISFGARGKKSGVSVLQEGRAPLPSRSQDQEDRSMTAQSTSFATSFAALFAVAFDLVTLGASPALAQQVGGALPGMSVGTSPGQAPTASVPRAGPLTSPLS